MNTAQILSAIDEEISRLEQARTLLEGASAAPSTAAPEAKRRGRPPGVTKPSAAKAAPEKPVRGMSEEGRARIAEAQKARWAGKKKADRQTGKAAARPAATRTAKLAKQVPAKKAAPAKAAPVRAPAKKLVPAPKRTPAPARPEPAEPEVEVQATPTNPVAEAPSAE